MQNFQQILGSQNFQKMLFRRKEKKTTRRRHR